MRAVDARSLLFLVPFALASQIAAQGIYREVHPARVWTVNALGGADFFDLPRAVATAHSGDVLLVAPADYSAFELRGKGLTILGDGGVPRVLGSTLVRGLPAGEVACLRSLRLSSGSLPSLRLENSAGTVWIEDCSVERTLGLFYSAPDDAACLVQSCAAVVFARSQVLGSTVAAFPTSAAGGAGLLARESAVHAFETVFAGVDVLQGVGSGGTPRLGGNGMTLDDATLYAAGSTFRGGQGQSANFNSFGGFCQPAAAGGAGLHAGLAASPPITLECTFQGGPGGSADPPFCSAGSAGPATAGTIDPEPLPLRSYELTTPVAGGTSYQLTARCEPGESVWSVFAESLAPLYAPALFCTQVGALPATLVFEGVADGTGTLAKSVPVPPLAVLASFERLWAQGLFFDEFVNAYLGTPSVLVVLP